MAETAYQLEHFAPREKQRETPRVRVSKRERSEAAAQLLRMVRTLLVCMVFVVLVCGVLYTHTQITELQGQITSKSKEVVEQEALYAYLSYELEGMSNLQNIKEKAEKLGLQKINANQVSYVRVDEGNNIEVKESPLLSLFSKAKTGLLNALDTMSPPLVEDDTK